jgi:hypothetical protein
VIQASLLIRVASPSTQRKAGTGVKTDLKTDVLKDAVTGQWRSVTVASALGAAHQTGEAAVPLLIGVVIDEAVRTGASGRLALWIGVLAAVFVALSLSFRFSLTAAGRNSAGVGLSARSNAHSQHRISQDGQLSLRREEFRRCSDTVTGARWQLAPCPLAPQCVSLHSSALRSHVMLKRRHNPE